MLIYLAGGSGFKKREISWLKYYKKRLLSFYEIVSKRDQHYHKGAFKLIKRRNK